MNLIFLILMSLYSDVDPRLAYSVASVESNYNKHAMGDSGKSYGLFQIKCSTAKSIGFNSKCSMLKNSYVNIYYGVKYLSMQLDKHSRWDAISAYNAGRPFLCEKYPRKCKKPRMYVNNLYVSKVQNKFAMLD